MSPDLTHAPTPDAESLAEPLRSRWSPSVFDAGHVLPPDQVRTLLEAARWAPSRGNSQPWGFVVAERGDAAHRALVPALSRGNAGWVPRASVVFVAATEVGEEAPEPAGIAEYALYDLGQAAAHLTLQARAMGLHAHQFAGFDKDVASQAFGIPATHRVLSGIAVGVRGNPDEVDERDREREQRERTRKPLGEVAHSETWGRPWRSDRTAP